MRNTEKKNTNDWYPIILCTYASMCIKISIFLSRTYFENRKKNETYHQSIRSGGPIEPSTTLERHLLARHGVVLPLMAVEQQS